MSSRARNLAIFGAAAAAAGRTMFAVAQERRNADRQAEFAALAWRQEGVLLAPLDLQRLRHQGFWGTINVDVSGEGIRIAQLTFARDANGRTRLTMSVPA